MVNMSKGPTFQDRLNLYDFVPPISDFFEIAKHVAKTAPSLRPSSTSPQNLSHYDAILREKTKDAIRDITASEARNQQPPSEKPAPVLSDGEALLIYIGNYFSKASHVCDQIFIGVLKCSEVMDAGMRWSNDAVDENDLDSHMRTAEAEQIIHKLFKMRDLTAAYAREMQEVWDPSIRSDENSNKLPPLTNATTYEEMMELSKLIPPGQPSPSREASYDDESKGQTVQVQHQQHQKRSIQTQTQSRHSLEHREKLKQENTSPPGEDSASDISEDEDDDAEEDAFAKIDMEALKSRGKGNHTCPKGKKCTKGGIDKDGELIVFDRNSAFVQHCNKHRKPYRCTLPGCPNQPKKRRFARRDGLERHQRSVPHLTTSLQTAS